ncbi:MAG: hypothetical protein GXO35_07325 [Gammaproteobacteria bacterium]|nr:hypothetical protein [Gammaproteobacteria bacterium]
MTHNRLIKSSLILLFSTAFLAAQASDTYTDEMHTLAIKTCEHLKTVNYAALLPDTHENTQFTVSIYAEQITKIDPEIIQQAIQKMSAVNCTQDISHQPLGVGHHQISIKGMQAKYNIAMLGEEAKITGLK